MYIIWNSSVRKICTFSQVYLLFQSFIYILWTHGFFFYSLDHNSILLLFIIFKMLQLFQDGSYILLTYSYQRIFFFFLAFPYFLALKDAPGSFGILPAPALQLVISPKAFWSSLLENGVRIQDLGTGHARRYWDAIAFRSSQLTELTHVCICI